MSQEMPEVEDPTTPEPYPDMDDVDPSGAQDPEATEEVNK